MESNTHSLQLIGHFEQRWSFPLEFRMFIWFTHTHTHSLVKSQQECWSFKIQIIFDLWPLCSAVTWLMCGWLSHINCKSIQISDQSEQSSLTEQYWPQWALHNIVDGGVLLCGWGLTQTDNSNPFQSVAVMSAAPSLVCVMSQRVSVCAERMWQDTPVTAARWETHAHTHTFPPSIT